MTVIIRKFYETQGMQEAGGGGPEPSTDNVEMNLPEDTVMGKDPKDTMKGAIISSKYGEEIIDRIIDFRVRLDSLHLTTMALMKIGTFGCCIRELSLARTAFQNARQYTGKLLQERGSESPYKGDGKQERTNQGEAIELDLQIVEDESTNRLNCIVAIGKLRDLTEDVITDYTVFGNNMAFSSFLETVASTSVMKGLIDGKMWLGEMLPFLSKK